MRAAPGPVCALYVPGDRPERFAKAVASGADLVVLDLEDAVAAERKDLARTAVETFVGEIGTEVAGVGMAIRVNARGTVGWAEDLELLRRLLGAGHRPAEVRLPKTESPADVAALRAAADVPVAALIESARGLLAAPEVAAAPGVVSVGLGEADLRSDLGIEGDAAFAPLRLQLAVAASAAGLRRPAMAAYPALDDLDGLARSCAAGRAVGCHGRSAVHPRQVPVIRRAFRPTAGELAAAREVLEALDGPAGAARTADGSMVDAAMRGWAEATLALAADHEDGAGG
ncbi:HpcH/HpaI aldolase/citrate lyase family protein [Nakamurella endophytica]|uniref:CoA ester lyase n=1 Tax=Nakamurella endophytica TaxID=1748367 RepID=A0A917T820_9ACTN|nr:aldolase/citrate lyase family protein [Nakamurella endophytica]GGM13932.1 CoA ester lyase [Nakamurella endophytica]